MPGVLAAMLDHEDKDIGMVEPRGRRYPGLW